MSLTVNKPLLPGAIASPLDENDIVWENLANFPSDVDALPEELILSCLPVRNQGKRGTCAAFAGAACVEKISHLSPEFIYYHRKNKPAHGMSGRDVFKILKERGVPLESEYPYGSVDPPSKKICNLAKCNRVANFFRITSLEGIKRALCQLGKVYIQLLQYTSANDFWRKAYETQVPAGLHAVVIIGYNKEGFLIRNSWGKEQNETIFKYSEYPLIREAWVGTKINCDCSCKSNENKTDCNII